MHPASIQVAAWVAKAQRTIDHIREHGRAPMQHSSYNRLFGGLMLGICCSPCLTWSIVWRVLLCPIQCCMNGPTFACSDNHCTHISDNCIVSSIDSLNNTQMDKIPFPLKTPEDKSTVLGVLTRLAAIFSVNAEKPCIYAVEHYVLTDTFHPCLVTLTSHHSPAKYSGSSPTAMASLIDGAIKCINSHCQATE